MQSTLVYTVILLVVMTIQTIRILLPLLCDAQIIIDCVSNLLANLPSERFLLKIGNQIINKVYLKFFRRYLESSLSSWRDRAEDISSALRDPTADIIWVLPIFLYIQSDYTYDYKPLIENKNDLFQQLTENAPTKIIIHHPDDPLKELFHNIDRYTAISIISTDLANKLLTCSTFINWLKLDKLLIDVRGRKSTGNVKKRIQEYEARIRALEEEMRKQKKLRKNLVKTISDATYEIEKLEEKVLLLGKDLQSINEKLTDSSDVEGMKDELTQKRKEIEEVEAQKSAKVLGLQKLMASYQQQQAKIASIQDSLESCQRKIEEIAESEKKDNSRDSHLVFSTDSFVNNESNFGDNAELDDKRSSTGKRLPAKRELAKRISCARIDTSTANVLMNTFVDKEDEMIRTLNLPISMKLTQEGIRDILHIIKDNNKIFKITIAHHIPDIAHEDLQQLIQNQNNLTTIDLSNAGLNDIIAAAVAKAIINNKNLLIRNLVLTRNNIGSEGGGEFGKMLRINRTLYTLDLRSNRLGNDGVISLCEGLQGNDCLHTLRLENNKFSQAGVSAYVQAIINPDCQISNLNISYNPLGDLGIEALSAVLKSPMVTGRILSDSDNTLKLIKCEIDDSTMKILSELLINMKIKMRISLNLKGNKLTAVGFNILGRCMKEKLIEIDKLNIIGNSLTGDSIDQFANGIISMSDTLGGLRMSWCDITDAILWKLMPAVAVAKLEEVHLGGNPLGSEGLLALCEILSQESYKVESSDKIKTKELAAINCLSYAKNYIKVLNLSWISNNSLLDITPLVQLIQLNGLSSLNDLHLVENQLGNEDIKPLANALHFMPVLRYVGLDYNNVTIDGALCLLTAVKSSKLGQLRTINLFKNRLNKEDAKILIKNFRNEIQLLEIIANTEYRITQPFDKSDNTKTSDDRFISCIKGFVKCSHLFDEEGYTKMQSSKICDLKGCELTNDAIDFVIDRFRKLGQGIDTLDLSENCLGISGIRKITDHFVSNHDQLKELKYLNISRNLLGNKAMKYIKILLEHENCRLKELDISDTKITIGGLKLIVDSVKNLRRLHWKGNLISQEEAADLFNNTGRKE